MVLSKLLSDAGENAATSGAGDGTRTRDPELGKLMLYQLSYARTAARLSMPPGDRYSAAPGARSHV